MKLFKAFDDTNPLITQHYGADPYALEYNGRVYFYMTADKYEYDKTGNIKENTYSEICSIYVISTDDMVNFTEHGEIKVAGKDGIAKWARNSWAPAAAWKMIDGKPKFFLYFADNGGGIGVITADSPIGPFEDPLGHGLIRRDMENCGNVEWLFDPAVLVDDDGCGYIYFGGGVPEGRNANPATARVARLGEDMISLSMIPQTIEPPYLFEDSGIHKFGGKYYYTYCSNFSVDEEGTKKYGMRNGEICCMESDNPLGPFVYKEMILENPEKYCGLGGNNHHHVFSFNGRWYITYHSRSLEKAKGVERGYRIINIEEIQIKDDGSIGVIPQTYKGRHSLKNIDPFAQNRTSNTSQIVGVSFAPADSTAERTGCGNMLLSGFEDDNLVQFSGIDFKGRKPETFVVRGINESAKTAEIKVFIDNPDEKCICTLMMEQGKEMSDAGAPVDTAVFENDFSLHNLFITVSNGDKLKIENWQFR